MTFDQSLPSSYENRYILTQRYIKEVLEEDMTMEEVEALPRWQMVWTWWLALEHYFNIPRTRWSMDEVKSIYGD